MHDRAIFTTKLHFTFRDAASQPDILSVFSVVIMSLQKFCIASHHEIGPNCCFTNRADKFERIDLGRALLGPGRVDFYQKTETEDRKAKGPQATLITQIKRNLLSEPDTSNSCF